MTIFSPTSSVTQFLTFLFSTPTPWMLALALLGHVALDRVLPPQLAGDKGERPLRRTPFYRESRGVLVAGSILWAAMAWGSLSPAAWAAGGLEVTAASVGFLLFSTFMTALWAGAVVSWLRQRVRR